MQAAVLREAATAETAQAEDLKSTSTKEVTGLRDKLQNSEQQFKLLKGRFSAQLESSTQQAKSAEAQTKALKEQIAQRDASIRRLQVSSAERVLVLSFDLICTRLEIRNTLVYCFQNSNSSTTPCNLSLLFSSPLLKDNIKQCITCATFGLVI